MSGHVRRNMHFIGQVSVDGCKYLSCDVLCFKQMAKLQQRRGVWCGLDIEINADETTDGLAIVDRIFNTFIG